jgi:hypothetical protein
MTSSPSPFTVAVTDAALDDLCERLRRTRWPADLCNEDWSYGMKGDYLRGFCSTRCEVKRRNAELKDTTALRNQKPCVGGVCMVVCDGLKGLRTSIETVWPQAITQTCVVHLLRNSFR